MEINLETDMIKSNINENINTVTQIKFDIMTILDEYIQAENENKQLIDEILGDIPDNEEKTSDEKTSLFGKLIDIGKSFLTTDLKSKTTEIKNKFDLWKKVSEYTIITGKTSNGYQYSIWEPENPDPNIPTVFMFEGDSGTRFSNTEGDYIRSLLTKETNVPNDDQKRLPYGFLAKEGLIMPNVRWVHIRNKGDGFQLNNQGLDTIYTVMSDIITDYNDDPKREAKIDIDNLSTMGFSARNYACITS